MIETSTTTRNESSGTTNKRKPPSQLLKGNSLANISLLSALNDRLPTPASMPSPTLNLDKGNVTIDSIYQNPHVDTNFLNSRKPPLSSNILNSNIPRNNDYFPYNVPQNLDSTIAPKSNKRSLDLAKDSDSIKSVHGLGFNLVNDDKNDKKFKKSDSHGLLSTIINVAHHVISPSTDTDHKGSKEVNSLHSKEAKEKETSFSHKLDFLLKPGNANSTHSKSSLTDDKDAEKEPSDRMPSSNTDDLGSSASQIHFKSVRESPLNTLGDGNLTLDAFLNPPSNKSVENQSYRRSRALSPGDLSEYRKRSSSRKVMSPITSTDNLADTKLSKINQKRSSASIDGASPSRLESSKSNGSYSGTEGESEEDDDDDDTSSHKFSSEKRNREFHQLFKKVPSSEKLIDNFSCALSKDILVQGRMYLSKNYICFNSNILGWVTHMVIPLQEVIQIEKRSTAVLFPNGIVIRTLHQKYIFATFLSRDTTFAIIRNVWHQVLREDNKLIRRKPKRHSIDSDYSRVEDTDSENSDTNEEFSDDETESPLTENQSQNNGESEALSDEEVEEDFEEKSNNKSSEKSDGKENNGSKGDFNGIPLIGPSTHSPTENGYSKQGGDTFICDENIKAPLGVIYNILYGPDKSYFIKLLKEQKNFDITEDTITELSQSKKERTYSYTKPLNGSIGPKQTKCNIKEKLIEYDLEKSVCVEMITQTPDVPSGNSFKVKSKVYLSWAENNTTKVYSITSIEWTGKSWIKGAIEKGSIDGQKQSMKDMISFLNSTVSSGGGSKGKKSKKKSRSRANTVNKKPESEGLVDAAESEAKSIMGQILKLAESVGSLVPIPMVSEAIVGFAILAFGFILSVILSNKLLFKSDSKLNFQVIPGDAFVSRIKINNQDFLIMPTVENNLENDKLRKEMEVDLWNWIGDRSNSKLSINKSNRMVKVDDTHKKQVLYQVVRDTEHRLKKLAENLRKD
jgi:hypothetical protein